MIKLSSGSVKLSTILKCNFNIVKRSKRTPKKMKKKLLSIKVPLIIENNYYERGNRWGGWGFKKKCFSHVFHFWKQQYFNKSRSGTAVIVVK